MERSGYRQTKATQPIGRRRLLAGGVGLAAAAGLATVGCRDDDNSPTRDSGGEIGSRPATAPVAESQVDLDAEIKVGFHGFPANLDPTSAGGVQSGPHLSMYNFLYNRTPDFQLIEGLASWEFRNDNTVYRISAKPGVEFHNGEPLDAEAIKFYFDRIRGRAGYNTKLEASPLAPRIAWMGDITVVDELTVDIQMNPPFVEAPEQSGGINFYLTPRQYILEEGDEHFSQNPVSVGPFKFESWIPDQELRMVRFDKHYFNRDYKYAPRLPWARSVVSRLIPEEQSRMAALEAGEIDVATRIGNDLAKSFRSRQNFKVITSPSSTTLKIDLPVNAKENPKGGGPNPWRDKRVRQAANYAIDADLIINSLLTGTEERTYAPFPPGNPPPVGSLGKPYSFDPKKARALLEEAGQVGLAFDVLVPGGIYEDQVWGPAVGKMLNDVGFQANMIYRPSATVFAEIRSRRVPGPFVFSAGGSSNGYILGASVAWSVMGVTGAPFAHSAPGDDLIPEQVELNRLVAAAGAEFDAKKRNDLYMQAAEIYYENAFAIFLFNLSVSYVTSNRIAYTPYSVAGDPALWSFQKLRE